MMTSERNIFTVLEDAAEPLPMADDWCQAHVVAVMLYLYSLPVFPPTCVSTLCYEFSIVKMFYCRHCGSWGRQQRWEDMQPVLEWEGLQEFEMILVGTPTCQLLDLIAQGINRLAESLLLPLGLLCLPQRSNKLLLVWPWPQRRLVAWPLLWHPSQRRGS